MVVFINKIISKVKGESFFIDERISPFYLIRFLGLKFLYRINGMLIFGCRRRSFVHCDAKIILKSKIAFDDNLNIDRGCYIDALSVKGIHMGKNVSIGKYTTIECTGSLKNIGMGLRIGDNVGLGTHGFWGCAGGISVGNDTIFGNYVSIHSENHNFQDLNIPIRLQGINRKGIVVGSNCWIGAKTIILDGAIIEDGCIIAAGSVVASGSYQSNCIYGGVPAKLIKQRR